MKHNFLFSLLFAFAFVAGSIAAQTSTGDYASKVNTLIGQKVLVSPPDIFIRGLLILMEWCSLPLPIFPKAPDLSSIS